MATQQVPDIMKLVIIGDGAVGKTCLLDRFEKDEFTADVYTPTVFHNTMKEMDHPEKPGNKSLSRKLDVAAPLVGDPF